MILDTIYPNNLIIKYDYIKIDNINVASIIVYDLPKQIGMLELNNILPSDIENTTVLYVKKLDSLNKVKELTKIIMETNSEIKSVNQNQQDIDILRNINKEATDLRKKLQIENEEIYSINIYISVKDISLDNLKTKVNKIVTNLYVQGVIAKVANFRHDLVYFNTLPFSNNSNNKLNEQTAINVTTSGLAYLMPYVSQNIIDQNGIVYGFINKSICIYDIFSKTNMNHNMCILGSSGAGKSYFLKTILLRNYCKKIMQVVFDIEGEYLDIADKIEGIVFNCANFNPLYIPENFVLTNKKDFLEKKINNVFKVLNDISEGAVKEYEETVKEVIYATYKEAKISEREEDMYTYYTKSKLSLNKEYMKYSKFPTYKDLIDALNTEKEISKTILSKLKKNIMYTAYSKEEAKKIDDKIAILTVFDLNSLETANINIYLKYIEEYYGKSLIIYIDELWKVITKYKKYYIQEKIAEMYKSIRKKNAGIVTTTQDIHDILGYNDGDFGKSILNNSYTKLFFKMQYMDINSLVGLGIFTNEDIDNIRKLSMGTAFMNIGDTKFNINIKTSEFEHEIIQGDDVDEKDFNCT